ncbi:heme-dependent oxidative N-demethylase family protein [Pseudohoeflea coraliihabitans]|uniref:DUF3445 domain-containing protein n=1 Tax=Pseudohoeflea coraliihabitans TaxID=2860393 RepID=A0ABS6WQ03_9HYPH|nr:DUF3445 domain-containing protein [Pseudohoeflea sp. DP4N28-3]MBW3097850.1 DUF3445 domain-containing protein [Pseudohoeflea sp. DP4N28-3]
MTPGADAAAPFAIGLTPLADRPWLLVDAHLPAVLAEKRRVAASHPDRVFAAEPATLPAQREVLDRVLAHQCDRHPVFFRREGEHVHIAGVPDSVDLDDGRPPLARAADLCAEDLVIMRRDAGEWRLAAAALHFPSSWRLAEKFSRPLDDVHAPVPGFGRGSRNATLIARIFDNLAAGVPVLRHNWSIYHNDRLHHPEPHESVGARHVAGSLFLREERQTLSRLDAAHILFTIHVAVTPAGALAATAAGRRHAAAIAAWLEGLEPAERAYKGLGQDAGPVVARLNEIAASAV